MSEIQLPHHWKKVKLGDIASEVGSGITPRGGEKSYLQSGIPLIRSQNVLMNRLSLEEVAYISPKMHQSMSRSAVVSGDVLLNITGASIGRVASVPESLHTANVNQHVCRLRLRDEANPEFVSFFLSSPRGQSQIMGSQFGTTRQGLNYGQVKALQLPFPPLSEQRAIAQALRTVQEARETRQRELTLERERKAALMDYLFTQGTRGEARKQTEMGEIPQSWEMVKLGELCINGQGLIQTGPFGSQLHASDYRETGIPVVNPTHLGFNTIQEDALPRIEKEKANSLSKHYLIQGDILISRRGDFSHYSYVTKKYSGWLCGTGCLLLRFNNPKLDNYFLSVLMGIRTSQDYLSQNSVGSIMPNLNTKILNSLRLMLPPLDEQCKIAEVLGTCDTRITALEQEIALLDELFKAMLEELMTGRLSALPLT
jgi:type I restriction enzyme S subunit